MANEKNLKPGEYKLSREEAKRGGVNSGKARREKKTVRAILDEYLKKDIKSNPSLHKIAQTAGLSETKSIKELVAAVCLLNTLKKGDVDELQKLALLLGEDSQGEPNNGILEELTEYMKQDVK